MTATATARNIGDYRTFKDSGPRTRKDLANKAGETFSVYGQYEDYEGDCIHVDEEGKPTGRQFGYYWPVDPQINTAVYQSLYDDLLDDGYRPVRAYREGEGEPGKGIEFRVNRWRVRPDGTVTHGGHVLMAIPAELIDERDEERRNNERIRQGLDSSAAAIHAEAAQGGLGTYVTRAGKTENVVNARK